MFENLCIICDYEKGACDISIPKDVELKHGDQILEMNGIIRIFINIIVPKNTKFHS